jgi:ATP-dependent Lon protease
MADTSMLRSALQPNTPTQVVSSATPSTPAEPPAAPSKPSAPVELNLPPVDPLIMSEINELKERIEKAEVPEELKFKLERELRHLERSARSQNYFEQYERTVKYLEWCLSVPWNTFTDDNLDLGKAKEVLEKHHYGMQDVKDRILEYMAILSFQKRQNQEEDTPVRAPILLLVGLVGTGKTTFAYSIGEALGREVIRVPFGGMGSARDLRGQSRLHLESEPGLIVKGLAQAKTRNPIMLLDEIDRVGAESRMDIMGVLVELLDPTQNKSFVDHYLDFPVNLQQVLFLATANNTRAIATAVMDRMEQIDMPSYTDEQKIVIAKQYIMPKMLEEAGMPKDTIILADDVWMRLVRPLGFDSGIRTLERTLKGVVSKSARIMIERGLQQVVITQENVKYFVPTF